MGKKKKEEREDQIEQVDEGEGMKVGSSINVKRRKSKKNMLSYSATCSFLHSCLCLSVSFKPAATVNSF